MVQISGPTDPKIPYGLVLERLQDIIYTMKIGIAKIVKICENVKSSHLAYLFGPILGLLILTNLVESQIHKVASVQSHKFSKLQLKVANPQRCKFSSCTFLWSVYSAPLAIWNVGIPHLSGECPIQWQLPLNSRNTNLSGVVVADTPVSNGVSLQLFRL